MDHKRGDAGVAYLDAQIGARKAREQQDEPAAPPEFSDDALALEFTRRHGEDLRYVAPWGKWLRFDGKRWAEDRPSGCSTWRAKFAETPPKSR